MLIIGLTGGIGSGKTAASDYLAKQGIEVVDADVIAHQLTVCGSPLLGELQTVFGDWILDENGNYNRAAVREYVFANANALMQLNAIVHPTIYQAILKRLENVRSEYTLLSVPLLFEGRHKPKSLLSLCHHLLVIDVPVKLQQQRTRHRDHHTPDKIDAIINKQISRSERLHLAQTLGADIVQNDGTLSDLHAKLASLHHRYLTMAKMMKKQPLPNLGAVV